MNNLTIQEKLEKILNLVKKHQITAYEIAKYTTISEAGVGKILNKLSKKPHTNTVDSIYNYVISYDKTIKNYQSDDKKFNILNENTTFNYSKILTKLNDLIKKLEAIKDPDINDLKNLKEAYDLRTEILEAE